jgi:hypothetical protein
MLVPLMELADASPLGSSTPPSPPPPQAVSAAAQIKRLAKGILEREFTAIS